MRDEYAAMIADLIPMMGMGVGAIVLVILSHLGQPGAGLAGFLLVWVASSFYPIVGFKFAEVWANSDYLIRPEVQGPFEYLGKSFHLWMDKSPLDTAFATFDSGLFGPEDSWVTDPVSGTKFTRPKTLPRGYSQVPLVMKQNMPFLHPYPEPYGSEHYKVYVRFKGDWAKRMPMMGCRANRWSFYDLWIKRGDKCVLWEFPWNDMFPDVPVVEADQSWHPVFLLKLAPGDYQQWIEDAASQMAEIKAPEHDYPKTSKEIVLEIQS